MEDFDRNKLIVGMVSAGCTPEEAERVASEIETWMPSVAVEGVVQSTDLRVKGMEVLMVVNPVVAATFEAYQKPAETPAV